jgi:EpsI family protein
MPDFLKGRAAWILTLVLVVQAALFYTLSHGEAIPLARPLSEFPRELGAWTMTNEDTVAPDIREVLRADDYLSRNYANASFSVPANLFVVFFKSQRTGQTPHSPRNCLPGAGWIYASYNIVPVSIPGQAEPIEVNRYVVTRGDAKDLVMYWYQSHGRVVASEYKAKIYVVADALRYNRTDTALVRVVVPITTSEDAASAAAVQFVQTFFVQLRDFLPS